MAVQQKKFPTDTLELSLYINLRRQSQFEAFSRHNWITQLLLTGGKRTFDGLGKPKITICNSLNRLISKGFTQPPYSLLRRTLRFVTNRSETQRITSLNTKEKGRVRRLALVYIVRIEFCSLLSQSIPSWQ